MTKDKDVETIRLGGENIVMKTSLPEQIYLQARDTEGHLLDATKNEVTWCVDRINENDTVYILATPKLAELLEHLANAADCFWEGNATHEDIVAAHTLAASIREALEVKE